MDFIDPLNPASGTTTPIYTSQPPAEANPVVAYAQRLRALTPHVYLSRIILVLNVLVYVVMLVKGVSPMDPSIDHLLKWGADFGPATITDGQWWRMLSSMFVHAGLIHIAFNMFVLWQCGPLVERLLGNAGFLITYSVSGFAGALVSLVWHPYVVSVGASGAIFGLYGAMLGFLALRRGSIPTQVFSPLLSSALTFLGYNLVYGFVRSGTDVADHFGGLAGGFFCGLVLSISIMDEPVPSRGLRNTVLAVGSAVVLFTVMARIPRPVDFNAELTRFDEVEKKTLAAYQSAIDRSKTEHLNDGQLADLIDRTVLPNWTAERKKVAAVHGLPDKAQSALSRLIEYMDLRQQGWTMMADGLRKHDVGEVQAANSKQVEAGKLVKQLTQGN